MRMADYGSWRQVTSNTRLVKYHSCSDASFMRVYVSAIIATSKLTSTTQAIRLYSQTSQPTIDCVCGRVARWGVMEAA